MRRRRRVEGKFLLLAVDGVILEEFRWEAVVGAAAVLALETTWFSFASCTRVVLCSGCF